MNTKTPLNKPKGFYTRGYLPHFDGGSLWQSVTIRLKDSLPASVIEKIKIKIECLPMEQKIIAEAELVERYLDKSYYIGLFRHPSYAAIVTRAIIHFDGVLYDLAAFVVMSNHAHLLIKLSRGVPLHMAVSILKTRTSKIINRLLGKKGSLWAKDYFDRYIRSTEHWYNVLYYIENNPLKIGIGTKVSEYPFSSAFYKNRKR